MNMNTDSTIQEQNNITENVIIKKVSFVGISVISF